MRWTSGQAPLANVSRRPRGGARDRRQTCRPLSIFVFVGPTISTAEASRYLQATYLPPVSQGDIVSLLPRNPSIIGIIDGYFEQVPSVWHKEILLALSGGVRVVGAASMGALRAAETDVFGMVGIGVVYQMFKTGEIDADDEVAVRHGPADLDYIAGNEALVNIRQTLALSARRRLISQWTLQSLLSYASRLPYPDRRYDALLQHCAELRIPSLEIERLRRFFETSAVDQKKLDAVEMLRWIDGIKNSSPPGQCNFELEHTICLENLVDRDFLLVEFGGIRITREILTNYARVALNDFEEVNRRACLLATALEKAAESGFSLSNEQFQKGLLEFRRLHQIGSDDELRGWRQINHLTEEEFHGLVGEWVIEKMISVTEPRSSFASNHRIIRQVQIEGRFSVLFDRVLAQEQWLRSSSIRPSRKDLLEAYRVFHSQPDMPSDELQFQAQQLSMRLGFQSQSQFDLEVVRHFLHQNHLHNAPPGEAG